MGKFNKTKEWLIEEYVIKGRARREIALDCGLSEGGLKSLLSKFEIKKDKLDLKKEVLIELINLNLNHEEIELKLGIGQTTLYRYLKEYNLKIIAEPRTISLYDDSDDLLMSQLYTDGFSSTEISKELGISHKTVLSHLHHYGVPVRTLSESQWNYNNKDIPKEFNSFDSMYELYITKGLSKKAIGIKFDCDPSSVERVLKLHGIKLRTNSESKVGLSIGEKHWNWQGGITPLAKRLREYFTVNQTKKVLARDNYTCQLCGCKKVLHVHHINSFSSLLHDILENNSELFISKDINELYSIATKDPKFLDLNNLITYCKDCHFYKIHKYCS